MSENEDLSEVKRSWDSAAQRYMERCESGLNPALAMLDGEIAAALSDVAGKQVLDAGCGYGRLVKAVTENGAFATAIDISEEMLRLARVRLRNTDPLRYRLLACPLSDMQGIESETFDKVFAINVLQDTPDLSSSIFEVARVTKPGGKLLIAIEHPVLTSGLLRNVSEKRSDAAYLSRRSYISNFLGRDKKISGWHRPITDYTKELVHAGFRIDRLEEPIPSSEAIDMCPSLAKWSKSPLFLVINAVRH